jgi:predicted  nucleic acid-binding Zn-ribbon protein
MGTNMAKKIKKKVTPKKPAATPKKEPTLKQLQAENNKLRSEVELCRQATADLYAEIRRLRERVRVRNRQLNLLHTELSQPSRARANQSNADRSRE